jgi:hypothetical protein
LVHLEQLGGARPRALQTISETAQLAAIPRTVPGSATDTQTAPPGGRDTDRVPSTVIVSTTRLLCGPMRTTTTSSALCCGFGDDIQVKVADPASVRTLRLSQAAWCEEVVPAKPRLAGRGRRRWSAATARTPDKGCPGECCKHPRRGVVPLRVPSVQTTGSAAPPSMSLAAEPRRRRLTWVRRAAEAVGVPGVVVG